MCLLLSKITLALLIYRYTRSKRMSWVDYGERKKGKKILSRKEEKRKKNDEVIDSTLGPSHGSNTEAIGKKGPLGGVEGCRSKLKTKTDAHLPRQSAHASLTSQSTLFSFPVPVPRFANQNKHAVALSRLPLFGSPLCRASPSGRPNAGSRSHPSAGVVIIIIRDYTSGRPVRVPNVYPILEDFAHDPVAHW